MSMIGVVVVFCVLAPFAMAQPVRPTGQELSDALDAGVAWLLEQQDPETGAWSMREGGRITRRHQHDVGRTALVGLALMNCGVPHHSPPMRKAIEYLQAQKVESTYAVSLRAAFFSQLPEAARRNDRGVDRLVEDRRWLASAAMDRGDTNGLYTYQPSMNRSVPPDLSNSQYAVLGLWYASTAGMEIGDALWRRIERGWVTAQNLDGGWGYRPDMRPDSYSSMTAAGVATLYVTYDALHARSELRLTRPREPRPATPETRPTARPNRDPRVALQRGMDWIAVHYAPDENAGLRGSRAFLYYMLYGYERVAEATGRTRFGEHVWFDQAADFIVRTQRRDGSWPGESFIDPMSNTAYALLVLSRGRAPVLLQKLEFDGRWNNRSRDAAQLARWVSRQTERHLNWQIVTPDASPAELRDSPILYLASDSAVELPDDFVQRLRDFLLQGGVLLAVAEGHAPATATGDEPATRPHALVDSIEQLAETLFPHYRFRDLPPDHILFTSNFPAGATAPQVRALGNGVRELIVLLPSGDMSGQWQRGPGTGVAARAPQFGLIGNLHLYMTDRANPRFKGEQTWTDPDPTIAPERFVRVARLRHEGNFDPEPAGWTRLSTILHNRDRIALDAELVDASDLPGGNFALVYVTSTDAFTLDDADRAALRDHLDTGGLALFDAAGGSRAAAVAFDELLSGMYPAGTLATLPIDHPIYTAPDPEGVNLQQVQYRRFAKEKLPRTQLPRLKAFTVDQRVVALVSEEDLCSGLVGHGVDGIIGYSPESAIELVRRIVSWASRNPVR